MSTSSSKDNKSKSKRARAAKNKAGGAVNGLPKADVHSEEGSAVVMPAPDTNGASVRETKDNRKKTAKKSSNGLPKADVRSDDAQAPKAIMPAPDVTPTNARKTNNAKAAGKTKAAGSKSNGLKADAPRSNNGVTNLRADTADTPRSNNGVTNLRADTADTPRSNNGVTNLRADTADAPHNDDAGTLLPVLFTAAIKPELEPVAASVRQIVARQQFGLSEELPHCIAVVSALPGEGVSTISGVFSTVLSRDFGVRTCRVDLSWGSPTELGLVDVVTGEASLDDVLEWDGHAATLHSGTVDSTNRHRLARSGELDRLMQELSGRFHHVILDLPSVLSDSEGLAMMRFADAYVLVVKHGVTTLQQVQMTSEQLSDTEVLGSVINHVRTRTPRLLTRWLEG